MMMKAFLLACFVAVVSCMPALPVLPNSPAPAAAPSQPNFVDPFYMGMQALYPNLWKTYGFYSFLNANVNLPTTKGMWGGNIPGGGSSMYPFF